MNAAVRMDDLKAQRLRNLISQLGLSRAQAAALLREVADDFDPSEQYRRMRDAAVRIQCASRPARRPKDSADTERQRRSRQQRRAGLRVLRKYPAVSDEHIALLVQAKFIPLEATEHDGDLVDAIVGLTRELAEAAR